VGKKRIGEQKGGATKQTELREQISLKFSGIIKLKKKAYMRQTLNTSHKTSAGSRNQTRPLISIQSQTTPCEEKEWGKRKREEVEIQPNRYAPQKWRGTERVGDQAGRRTQMQAWGQGRYVIATFGEPNGDGRHAPSRAKRRRRSNGKKE